MTEPDLLPRLAGWRDETRTSIAALNRLRQQADENAKKLESPPAVLEFIDFFAGFFTEDAATYERVGSELEHGPKPAHSEALRKLDADDALDLVVTDLVMPAMTGWEVAAEVKARRPQLPVGVVTGAGEVAQATPGVQAAVDFVLTKPVTLDALEEVIHRLGGEG